MTDPHEALNPLIRTRRIAVCGGTRINLTNAIFAEALGKQLAAEEGLMLVTGGFKCFTLDPEIPSGDWSFVSGAREYLRSIGLTTERKIETLLPDPTHEPARVVRFREGTVIILKGRSLQSRRFKLVGSVDTLVAIEGAKGTREIIDLALALEKPILPLPFTEGVARMRWNENRKLICEWFEVDKATAKSWEEVSIGELSGSEVTSLARGVKQHLFHQLRRKCFVMMPFGVEFLPLYEQAIKPALEDAGLLPIRTDQLDLVGDVVSALHSAIRSAACGLAVITQNNPNVMYELGLAHAQGKPVILLCEIGPEGHDLPNLPYDLQHESVFGYRAGDWPALRSSVAGVLNRLKGS
ncbi:MAG: hypothetical protein ACKVS6_06120 [Planctomycetota bacterium]